MVLGEFSIVIFFFKVSLFWGWICVLNFCGRVMNSFVGIRYCCMGVKEIGLEILVWIFIFVESLVVYVGSGCFDLLIICMFIFSLFII